MSWIKMRDNLDSDPDVIGIAGFLGIKEIHAIGHLWKIWTWADQHSLTGNAMRVTNVTLDKIADCPGLAEAMRSVGWLEGEDFNLCFPNFDRHNGQTAKNRALTALRVGRHRNAKSVTNVTVQSLPEKRREESTEKGALLGRNDLVTPPPLQPVTHKALPEDSVQHAEAEFALREIAKRVYEEEIGPWGSTPIHDHWLNIALPIPRPRWDAFIWLYSLPADDEIFINRKHLAYTQRRQTFGSLLRNLKEECEKAFSLQKKYESSLGDIDAISE